MATSVVTAFTLAMIVEKISSVIYPQILQLINIHLTKYVNTGDRIQDGIWVLIINTTITLIISGMYTLVIYIGDWVSKKTQPANTTNILNAEELNKTYTTTAVITYNFKINIGGNFERFISWVKEHSFVDHLTVSKTSELQWGISATTGTRTLQMRDSYNLLSYHFPVYQYTVQDVQYYVYVSNCTLYSMHVHALEYVYCAYYEWYTRLNECQVPVVLPVPLVQSYSLGKVETSGTVNPKCSFDRIHFTQKPTLLRWLHLFQTKTMYPEGLPLSNKLGILLHGPPGTGKSGTVGAIAIALNRHILMVNTLVMSGFNQSDLVEAIRSRRQTHIIVFDEFDYMIKEESAIDFRAMLVGAEGEERMAIIDSIRTQKEAAKNKVDLRFVLNLFDGVGDEDGRVFVCCTNNPHLIPPVVLRPGRLDLKLELSYATREMFVEIVKTVHPNIAADLEKSPELVEKVENALKRNITPLVLINALVTDPDLGHMLETLTLRKTQSYDSKME